MPLDVYKNTYKSDPKDNGHRVVKKSLHGGPVNNYAWIPDLPKGCFKGEISNSNIVRDVCAFLILCC
jgi:hypothetical protein